MTENTVFIYGGEELAHISLRDPKLGSHIERIGMIRREITPDLFESLTSGIISQQVSAKAAATVYVRLSELAGEVTPNSINKLDIEAIQSCGMSMRKASYILSAASAALDGRLPLDKIPDMADEEVINVLDALPGIGRWTAEMLLIFSLRRPDILSYDDLGIRRGLMKLHGLDSIKPKEFEIYRSLYSPYGSVASFYLWHIAGE